MWRSAGALEPSRQKAINQPPWAQDPPGASVAGASVGGASAAPWPDAPVCLQSSRVELKMMEAKRSSLLSRAECLGSSRHHGNLQHKMDNLTQAWKQLEVTLTPPPPNPHTNRQWR